MRKLMLLAAMLAMMLVAAAPAFAQATVISDDDTTTTSTQVVTQVQVAEASQMNFGDANAAADDGSASATISQDLSIEQSAVQNAVMGDDNFTFGSVGNFSFLF